MKQIMVDLKKGAILVEEVPSPVMKGEGVLVHNHYSVISGGTEGSLLNLASSSYLSKARKKPDLFKKVLEMARKQGPLTAYQAVRGRLNKPEPLGYSCAGIVSEASANSPFSKGDRVACGGVGFANHADVVYVPKNLCVKVPDNVTLKDAAFTTIGSIAMQGVRNAELKVGEKALVIGLGLIGQITAQILKASGLRVFGIDLDKKKIDLAMELGMDDGAVASAENLDERASAFSGGKGFDAVIITAATSSNEPLASAGRLARYKGRIVLVGVVGMEIPRDTYYAKELEFVISSSYGPGRYDPEYEDLGHDYPYGYVRWTEKRNMDAFLDLISQGKIKLEKLATHEFHIERAADAYSLINGKQGVSYLGIVLRYNRKKKNLEKVPVQGALKKAHKGDIRLGWVGAGSFAMTTLLPAVKDIKGVDLIGISAGSGAGSSSSARVHGFRYASSDHKSIIKDPKVDAVVITTRNSTHAQIAIEALNMGKHVFVEKPMALTSDELIRLVDAHRQHPDQVIQVGYNRRYAHFTSKIKEFFEGRKGPMMIYYRVNSGKLPKNSWIYEDREGGSRYITELCHFMDYCQFLSGSKIVDHNVLKVEGGSLSEKEEWENVIMTLKFGDGSVATILYNTVGDPSYSKEFLEVHSEGSTAIMTDFRELELIRNGKKKKFRDRLRTDKGHRSSIVHFLNNIKRGKSEFDEYIPAMEILLDDV